MTLDQSNEPPRPDAATEPATLPVPGQVANFQQQAAKLGRPARPLPEAAADLWAGTNAEPGRPAGRADDDDQADDAEPLAPIPEYPADPPGPLGDFTRWVEADGLHRAFGASAGLGALASMCGAAVIEQGSMRARPSIWQAIVGPPSSGKSPVIKHAAAVPGDIYAAARETYEHELAEWEALPKDDRGPHPIPPPVISTTDPTIQAVARMLRSNGLAGAGYAAAVVCDELDAYLSGLGAYNQGNGGGSYERAKLREMWTGAATHILRVGTGGKTNEVDIYVPSPSLPIYGALLPGDLDLLGKDSRGDRARWMLALAPARRPTVEPSRPYPSAWVDVFGRLADVRGIPRVWTVHGAAFNRLQRARERWAAAESEPWPAHVIQALRKADSQALRVALVLAESMAPGEGGHVPLVAVEAAIAHVDYSLDCWRALDGGEAFALSRADERMHDAIEKIRAWIDDRAQLLALGLAEGAEPRPGATARDITRAQPAGIMDRYQLGQVLIAYGRRYPGCVREYKPPRGPASTVVYVPARSRVRETGNCQVTVSPEPRADAPGETSAGQRDASDPKKTVGYPTVSLPDSFYPTVSPDSWSDPDDPGAWPEGTTPIGAPDPAPNAAPRRGPSPADLARRPRNPHRNDPT